jgi:hypothetical protein
MTANDLLTVGAADAWFRAILSRVDAIAASVASPAGGDVVLYSVAGLAAVLSVDPLTVRRWLKTGKAGKNGQNVKLKAYYFTSEARIPWAALLAYERGEDFDLAKLPAPGAPPPKASAPPEELPAMRVAS